MMAYATQYGKIDKERERKKKEYDRVGSFHPFYFSVSPSYLL